MGQLSFFSLSDRLQSISKMGDPLERLAGDIPWESFRPLLSKIYEKARKSNAGRRPLDVVLMFKTLILQTLHGLSDDRTEYLIKDRLSFARFLALGIEDRVPDAKSIWLFRERLKQAELLEPVFKRFDDLLCQAGLEACGGQIIDATIVPVPIQRNKRDDNDQIKGNKVPADWSDNKRRQKDTDARWTKKHGKSYFGYKDHINVDARNKLIRDYEVTPANVHDSQVFDAVLDTDNVDADVWADSAYRSEATEHYLQQGGYISHICEKGSAVSPLTEEQKAANRQYSRIRSRVEHVFGFMVNTMGSKRIRSIGLARAKIKIGLSNLTYNLMRYLQLSKGRSSVSIMG